MGEELDAWLMSAENLERWVQPGGMSAGDRRILMTTWVAHAWERMCRTFDFQRLFEKTGCLMSANGCNVNFVGCPEFQFTPHPNSNTVPTDPNASDSSDEDVDCGDDDESVPVADSRMLAASHGSAELRVIEGVGHRLRHDPRAIAVLLGWLDRQRTLSA